MTCELFNGECEECNIKYCPDQIEELNFEYLDLKNAVKEKIKELEDAKKDLEDFKKDHQTILI